MCSVDDLGYVRAITCVCGRIWKFRLVAQVISTEEGLLTSTEFFILTTLLMIEINNTATRGISTSRIPYGDQ